MLYYKDNLMGTDMKSSAAPDSHLFLAPGLLKNWLCLDFALEI